MTELLLGIDVGTASSKAVLVTPDGTLVAEAARDHRLSLPRPGWVEHDAEAVWWDDVVALCGELLPAADGRVAAVGVSGIGPCVVPCDADDRPLRPAILYGVDTRAEREVAELTEILGAQEILARGGSALSSQALGPKLRWLWRHEPEVWAATRRWHMASSFVVARLTGAWMLDHHSASQCDPLYDLAAGDWNEAWADSVVPGLTLPPLHWPGDVVGTVHAAGAAATGLPLGTPVVAGTIDAWAEAASVGVRAPGDLMLMYGSTTFIVLVATSPATSPAVWTTAGVDPGTLTLAAGTATSGSITAWLRDLTGGRPFADLTREAASVPAGAGGLLLLPYFEGERTPIHDPSARGVLVGLTLRHTHGHLYRAALEATAFAVRHILETMADTPATRVVAVGGGTRGALWTSIVSDVCGVTQEVPAVTVGAAYGDALLAGQGVGLVADAAAWTSIVERVEPRQEHRERYDELYRLYRGLYPATRDAAHAMAALQHADARGREG